MAGVSLLLVVGFLLAGCGSTTTPSSNSATSTNSTTPSVARGPKRAKNVNAVKTGASAQVGDVVLTNSKGLTLYDLSGETRNHLICTPDSGCLYVWTPLAAVNGYAPGCCVAGLSVIKGSDGSDQVAFQGHLLYTFNGDKKAGDAHGIGQAEDGSFWYPVVPKGQTITLK